MLTPGPLAGRGLLIFPGQPKVMASLKPSLTVPTPQPHSSQAEQAAPLWDPQTAHPDVAPGTASESNLADSSTPRCLSPPRLHQSPEGPGSCGVVWLCPWGANTSYLKPAPLPLSGLRAPNQRSIPMKLLQQLPSSHKGQRPRSFPSRAHPWLFWEMSHPRASRDPGGRTIFPLLWLS